MISSTTGSYGERYCRGKYIYCDGDCFHCSKAEVIFTNIDSTTNDSFSIKIIRRQ